ncbi:hypothetical protein [Aquabacterium sp. J223]|uniref:hypothetical protein n=1 Tax=Aquabacterium sp. J223 TaxID=2898431 RepID=UPI0021AD7020|nr:hypothetical protein [Aquabacterium sp. J223]UUX97546.1 hypothetical protein LRS07_10085 [Aquabacterium sp. J223]
MTPSAPRPADAPPLESLLDDVEQRLAALGVALRERDVHAIDQQAGALHRALAQAVHGFGRAARAGGVPPPLRRRLADASGQVAAQRESLARATAALDRAIDVLLPRSAAGLYGAHGGAERVTHSGSLQA